MIKMPFVFRKLFKKGKYDLVPYATPNASFYASLGALMVRVKRRVYCQWGIRYVGNSGLMRRALKFLEKITCMCSTHIRPASWKNLDYAVSEKLYKRDKASVIGDGGTVGIDFTNRTFEPVNFSTPIKFGYTGSMVIGRDKTLALLADAINKVNSDGNVKAELYIYSQTQPSDEILSRINVGASHYCGRVGRDEVIEIQKNAHVVVFAEALSGKEANAAKLSFSTKITDYLSNGKCILAIGKDYIPPIDYFTRNDSALVASDVDSIANREQEIIEPPSLINKYGSKAFECARRNHDKQIVAERFISVMKKAVS